jgi:hypothetical protein
MHDETRVIRRLIRVGQQGAISWPSNAHGANGIVLWARMYNATEKKQEPYICLGRLGYHSHVAGSQPLEFVWTLLDYDGLVQHADEGVRNRFQMMAGEYGRTR